MNMRFLLFFVSTFCVGVTMSGEVTVPTLSDTEKFQKLQSGVKLEVLNLDPVFFEMNDCVAPIVSRCTNVTGGCTVTASTSKCGRSIGLNVAPQVQLDLENFFKAITPKMMNLGIVSTNQPFELHFLAENSYSLIVNWKQKGIEYRAFFALFTKEMLNDPKYNNSLPPVAHRELQTLFSVAKGYKTILKMYLSLPGNVWSEVGDLRSKKELSLFINDLATQIGAVWIDKDNALNITYLNVPDPRKPGAVHETVTIKYTR